MNVSVQEMRRHLASGAAHPILDVTAWGDSIGYGFAQGARLPTARTKEGAGADWLRQSMPQGVNGSIVASIGANIDNDAQTLALAQEAIQRNPGAQFTFLIPANRPQLAQSLSQFGQVKPVTPSASDPMRLHPDMAGYRALASEVLGGGQQQARNPKLEAAQLANGVAQQLGVNPADVLTAIGYETAGSYDQWQRGPRTKWGQHRGRIQWGEPQRRKYGVYQGMPLDQEIAATARYLQDAGVRPGMGLEDIYSAINAGGVGKPFASDRPGMNVRSHVAGMGAYQRQANELLSYAGNVGSDPTLNAINRSPRLSGPDPVPVFKPRPDYRAAARTGAAVPTTPTRTMPVLGGSQPNMLWTRPQAPVDQTAVDGPVAAAPDLHNRTRMPPVVPVGANFGQPPAQPSMAAPMQVGPLGMPPEPFLSMQANPPSVADIIYPKPEPYAFPSPAGQATGPRGGQPVEYAPPMPPAPRPLPMMKRERGFDPFQGPGPVTGPYSILNDYTPASMFMFGQPSIPMQPAGRGLFARLFGG